MVGGEKRIENFGNNPLYFVFYTNASLFGAVKLDDVRIYNRALTPKEITRLYNMGR